jgi:hypothetical protein
MPSTNLTYNNNGFINSHPSFDENTEYDKNLRFNTQTANLSLNNTNHKIVSVEFTLPSQSSLSNGSNGIKQAVVAITPDPNSSLSVFYTKNLSLTDLDGSLDDLGELFLQTNPSIAFVQQFDLTQGYTSKIRFLVCVNADDYPKTQNIKIQLALGYKGNITSSGNTSLNNFNVGLSWDCDFNPIYNYTVGVHPWSPYDAVASRAQVTTKLYSFTPIANWGVDTRVFSTSLLENPALSYYYGYGNNVYRVGDKWSRSYGNNFYVKVKKRRFGKPKQSTGWRPIAESYDPINETSNTCTVPVTGHVGEIREVLLSNGLPQPQKYRYYMGYHASNRRSSNDDFFVAYSYEKKKNYPVTGLQHSLGKIGAGHIRTYYNAWAEAIVGTVLALWAGYAMFKLNFFDWIWKGIRIRPARNVWNHYVAKNYILDWGRGGFKPTTITAEKWFHLDKLVPGFIKDFFSKEVFKIGAKVFTVGAIISWALLIYSIIKLFLALFKKYTYYYEEACNKFLHHFTDSPYLEIGDILYRNEGMSVRNNGWYCDGANYYYQNSSGIISKTLSSTFAYMQDNPFTQQFLYSSDPKSYGFVESFPELHLLCYMAGKPEPYCGGGTLYQSQERSVTISSDCCDLQQGVTETVTIKAGEAISCVSLADANSTADQMLSASVDALTSSINLMGQSIDDTLIDQYDVEFTHEIKIEDNPTYTTLYRDNRSGSLAIGDPLYTDINGCHHALSGYYATSSGAYFKEFYKVADGKIVSIDYLSSSGSSTTTSGKTVSYSNLEYTSDWMFKGFNKNFTQEVSIYSDSDYDTRLLYTSSSDPLLAGYYISASLDSGSLLDFRIYPNSSSTGVVNTGSVLEAESGWYLTLVDWIDSDNIFEYEDTLVLFTSSVQAPNDGLGLNLICNYSVSQLTQSYYHNGSNSLPAIGDRIYTSTGSRALIPRKATNGAYKINSTDYITVSNGVVINKTTCLSASLDCNSVNISMDGSQGQGIYDYIIDAIGIGYLTASFSAETGYNRVQLISGSTIIADSLFVGNNFSSTNSSVRQGAVNDVLNTTALPYYVYNGSTYTTESFSTVTNFTMDDIATTGSTLRPSGSDGSVGDQIGIVGGFPSNTSVASDGDIKLSIYRNFIPLSSYPHTLRVYNINNAADYIINHVTCFDNSNGSGNDVDPALLRYNAAGGSTACTSSLQTFYISGSFTGTLHGIWTDSSGTTRAKTGSYSNGSVWRLYSQLLLVDEEEGPYVFSSTQSCSSNTVLSSSMLAPGFTSNGACSNGIYTRYWWEGGSNWYNSTTLYSTTSSNGQGNQEANFAWWSDGVVVNEYQGPNGTWGNVGICGGGIGFQ